MKNEAKELKEKTPDELFAEKQAAMSNEALIGFVEEQIHELARTGGRSHKMCVPPMTTDTDMLLCELLRRFKLLCEGKPIPDSESKLNMQGVIKSADYKSKLKSFLEGLQMQNIDKALDTLSVNEFKELGVLMSVKIKESKHSL